MDEGILEVSEVAEDRVVELHGVGLITCEREGIVGGDEGPVGGVAQGVHCHGVTVGHQEMEEEEIEQEVEGEKEEKRSNNNAHVHGWDDSGRQVRMA